MNNTYIIAEIGPNHNGSVEMALQYIDELSDIGANAIKFQLTNSDDLFSNESIFADYQKSSNKFRTAKDMIANLQLKPKEHLQLYNKCKEKKIDYLCTAFDLESLIFLNENMNLKYFKIASGEIFSIDMLQYMSNIKKPIIFSTGMATFDEIELSLSILNKNFKKDITLLHCISNYPTSLEDVNLNIMNNLKGTFNYSVGFSDHTIDNLSSIAAVSMGAKIIEKHVTFDKNSDGPDHKASSTINEFSNLVNDIRKIELIKGSNVKEISDKEKEVATAARKSITAKYELPVNKIITNNDICFKRPGTGVLPYESHLIIGKKVKKLIKMNDIIKLNDIS